MSAAFDPAAVARQILQQPPAPLPAQTPATAPARERPPFQATEHGLLPDSMTDRGLAKTFARLYARDFRHVNGLGWYRWSGARWEPDEHESVVWAAGDMAEELATTDPTGTYTNAEMRRERKRAMSTSGIKAVLQQARAARGMRLDASLLDADPYKLCTPGGVVDLTTGSLQRPDPEHDFHSRSALTPPEQMPTPAGTSSWPTPSGRTPKAVR